jgi:hypothetical protein
MIQNQILLTSIENLKQDLKERDQKLKEKDQRIET